MNTEPKRAALWKAVSSLDQADEDKISLDYQEEECRKLAHERGYSVVDVLSVDGYSRSESDLLTALDELRDQGVTAYDRIREHWQNKTIDVLVVYTDSRLGRSPSLYTHVFDNLLSNHINIDTVQGGLINFRDRRMRNAMGIIAITADLDRLRDQFDPGMTERVRQGKPVATKDTFTHKIVRDSKGKSYTYAIREENRDAAQLMAQAVIDRRPYSDIATLLGFSYGVKNARNNPIWASDLYAILHSAVSWGNIARKHYGQRGIWVFDESAPLPEGVIINRNTHESMWTGDTGIALKEELRRRATLVRGRALPYQLSMFSGLIYCSHCGYQMQHAQNTHRIPIWRAYSCTTNYPQQSRVRNVFCTADKKSIPLVAIQDWLTPRLEHAFRAQSAENLFSNNEPQSFTSEIEVLNKLIAGKRANGRKLMEDKLTTPASLLPDLQAMIDEIGAQVNVMNTELERLKGRNNLYIHSIDAQRHAISEMKSVSISEFWALPEDRINQILFAIFGNDKLVVDNGEIARISTIAI